MSKIPMFPNKFAILASVLGVNRHFDGYTLGADKFLKLNFLSRYTSILMGRGNGGSAVLHAMVSGYGYGTARNTASKISTANSVKIYTDNTADCILYISNESGTTIYLQTIDLMASPSFAILDSLPSTAVELA